MRDLVIPELNTPEMLAALGKYLQLKNIKFDPERIVFRCDGVMPPGDSTSIHSNTSPLFYPNNLPQITLATCTIRDFVGHCGIRTIGHVRINLQEAGKLFMDVFEAWVHSWGYSGLVGGDGQSAYFHTHHNIKNYGSGWTFVEGENLINRRMKKPMSIYYKLKLEPAFVIDWARAVKVG